MSAPARIALVTGGSRGLGRATILSLASKGVSSIFTYVSNPSAAEAVIAQINSLGTGAKGIALQLDVSKPETIDSFISSFQDALSQLNAGKFDILINNAGVGSHGQVASHTIEDLDKMYNIHYKSPFLLTQKTLPMLRDGGRIVNVSTGLTRFTNPGFVAYASMKGAIETFTKYLAQEVGARGISAIVVAPGAAETDFGGGVVRDNKDVNAFLSKMTAMKRMGKPEEIGSAIASLCDKDMAWVNGTRIEVSGGQQI